MNTIRVPPGGYVHVRNATLVNLLVEGMTPVEMDVAFADCRFVYDDQGGDQALAVPADPGEFVAIHVHGCHFYTLGHTPVVPPPPPRQSDMPVLRRALAAALAS
jgi:hypothetical protein